MTRDSAADGGVVALLARWRVALGFLCGAAALALAQPTTLSIASGMSLAALGEALRVWAAGHVNKAREVTTSGPYRWIAHPLYAGSTIMGVGLAIACASTAVAILIAAYLAIALTAAIKNEEAFLRRRFGNRYDQYKRGEDRALSEPRRFSFALAIANREHRAVAGLLVALLLLVLKATYNGSFGGRGG